MIDLQPQSSCRGLSPELVEATLMMIEVVKQLEDEQQRDDEQDHKETQDNG